MIDGISPQASTQAVYANQPDQSKKDDAPAKTDTGVTRILKDQVQISDAAKKAAEVNNTAQENENSAADRREDQAAGANQGDDVVNNLAG
ncbi:MAG: hypothetical protein GC154_16545 [bacterium]|nr:hypothetical protein [bacterium]